MAAIANGAGGLAGSSATDTNAYNSASFTSVAGSLVVFAVANTKATTPDPVSSLTLSGAVTNIQPVATVVFNTLASPTQRLSLWCGISTGAATTVQFNFGGTQTGAIWNLQEYKNVNVFAGLNGIRLASVATYATDTATTAATINTVTPADVHNGQLVWYNQNGANTATPKAGWTENGDTGQVTAPALALEHQWRASNDSLSSATLSGSAVFGAILVELISVDALAPAVIPPRLLTPNPPQMLPTERIIRPPVATLTTITGTLATTNANDTSAAAGTTTVTGTLAKTNANDTSTAAGTTTVTGALARTNANDTLAASGSVGSAVSGTLATTNANDTVTAAGTTKILGTSATTNANDTLSASGVVGTPVVTPPPPAQQVGGTLSGRRGPYTVVDAELEKILADDDEILCLI